MFFQVCGHRWRNTYFKIEIDIMVGVCYSSKTGQNISSAVGVTKLLPLLDPGIPINSAH